MKKTLSSMLYLATMVAVVMFNIVGCSVVDDVFSAAEEVSVVDYGQKFEAAVSALEDSLPSVGAPDTGWVKLRPACISEAVRNELPAEAVAALAAACPKSSRGMLVRQHDDLLVPATFWIEEDNSSIQSHLLAGEQYFDLWTMAGLNSVTAEHTVCSGDLSRDIHFLQAAVIEAACRKYSLTTYKPPTAEERVAAADALAEKKAAMWRQRQRMTLGDVEIGGTFNSHRIPITGEACPRLSSGSLASNCF